MLYFTVFIMVSSLCLFTFRIIGFSHETLLHCACGVPLYCNCVAMIRLTEPSQCLQSYLHDLTRYGAGIPYLFADM